MHAPLASNRVMRSPPVKYRSSEGACQAGPSPACVVFNCFVFSPRAMDEFSAANEVRVNEKTPNITSLIVKIGLSRAAMRDRVAPRYACPGR